MESTTTRQRRTSLSRQTNQEEIRLSHPRRTLSRNRSTQSRQETGERERLPFVGVSHGTAIRRNPLFCNALPSSRLIKTTQYLMVRWRMLMRYRKIAQSEFAQSYDCGSVDSSLYLLFWRLQESLSKDKAIDIVGVSWAGDAGRF